MVVPNPWSLDFCMKGLILLIINDIIIGKMTIEDIEEVLVIENLCFTLPWTRQSFVDEISQNNHAHYHIIKHSKKTIGYSGLWKVLDEGHITNIAIHPDYRRMGMASKLLNHMLDYCVNQQISSLTLEVRASNIAAQNLYKKYGFVEAGIRKAYYSDNKEDAIIMWKNNVTNNDNH